MPSPALHMAGAHYVLNTQGIILNIYEPLFLQEIILSEHTTKLPNFL